MPASSRAAAWAGRPCGDDRVGGSQLADHLELRGFDVVGGEAEHADAPRRAADGFARAFQDFAGLLRAGQRERDERQCPARGDLGGEGGLVAHPGHRALRDRLGGAERAAVEAVPGPSTVTSARSASPIASPRPRTAAVTVPQRSRKRVARKTSW